MKKYCVIGARGGSKGIPDKNIQLINGKSLLSIAVEKAIKANIFDKIFVLESLDGEKIMLTYNVDMGNSSTSGIIDNTILVHRKKQTNTLYTINALNELIKSLNNGVLDKRFPIEWNDYKNCILLIQTEGFNKIDTKIREIIKL